LIVHAAPWVVPVATPPLRDGAVVLDGAGTVHAVGPFTTLRQHGPAIMHQGVLLPGLINAHTHVELSALAGRVPGGRGLADWIARLVALRAGLGDGASELASAAASLVARGTVAVGDVSNRGRAAPVLRAAGLEVIDFDEHLAPDELAAPFRPGAVPTGHATYTCGAGALRRLAAATGGRLASIHVEEDPDEAAYLVEGAGALARLVTARGFAPHPRPPGLRPVEWLDQLGLVGEGTLLVHLACAGPATLALVRRRGAVAVLCPRSNLHVGGHLPPWEAMRSAGLAVALGTDSLASSPSLDVLGEVAVLARAGADPAWLVDAATRGGARALGLDRHGALAPGLCPGLVEIGEGAARLDDPLGFIAHEGEAAPVRRVDGAGPGRREVGA
jgi:cytosine/adenosine deaminase-related metal-dependent hydrolase